MALISRVHEHSYVLRLKIVEGMAHWVRIHSSVEKLLAISCHTFVGREMTGTPSSPLLGLCNVRAMVINLK